MDGSKIQGLIDRLAEVERELIAAYQIYKSASEELRRILDALEIERRRP